MVFARALFFAALLVSMTSSGAAQPTTPARQDFVAEREVGAWVSMWNTYDLNRVDDLFLLDSRLTYFSSEKEGLIRGIDAVRDHHRDFGFVEGGKPPQKKLWVEDVQADPFGTTAVVTAIWWFGDPSEDRKKIQHGPVTFVYVLEEGRYRLAHLHFANY